MKIRTRVLLAVITVACVIVGIAVGTPIVGLNFANILSNGNTATGGTTHSTVKLPPAAGKEPGDDDNEWKGMLYLSGPTNVLVQDVDYFAGGHTGWHSHPGLLVLTVVSGSLEWYDASCNKTVRNAGDSFTENTATHYFRNVGTGDVHVTVTYLLAAGQPRRIDQAAPACAAALGLD
jgi:quercetin dioxygenase-like cupin family protein